MFDQTQSPVDEYNSFADVIGEVRDVYVDDLIAYSSRFSPEFLRLHNSEPQGVYIRGRLEPILNFDNNDKRYYSSTRWKKKGVPDITTFEEFIETKEPVVDESGRVISTNSFMLKHLFSPKCSYHYSAIYSTACFVWTILKGLNRQFTPSTRILNSLLNIDKWIDLEKSEQFYALQGKELAELTDKIYEFIGKDYFNLYSLRLQNTGLFVEKGNDFRVIEYYRPIFEKLETERFEQYGY